MSEQDGEHDHEGQDRRKRSLTDEDIEALANVLEARLVQRFYHNLGRGIWGLIWKGIVAFLLYLAAAGAFTKHGA